MELVFFFKSVLIFEFETYILRDKNLGEEMKSNNLLLTNHALKRLRERLSIKKRAAYRHVCKVLANGIIHKTKTPNLYNIVFDDHAYLFSKSEEKVTLITVKKNDINKMQVYAHGTIKKIEHKTKFYVSA